MQQRWANQYLKGTSVWAERGGENRLETDMSSLRELCCVTGLALASPRAELDPSPGFFGTWLDTLGHPSAGENYPKAWSQPDRSPGHAIPWWFWLEVNEIFLRV